MILSRLGYGRPRKPDVPVTPNAQQLHSTGVVMIHRLLSADETANVRSVVHRIYDLLAERQIEDEYLRDHFNKWLGVWMKALPEFLEKNDRDLFNAYEAMLRLVCDKVNSDFGGKCNWLPQQSFFRRHVGVAKHLAWHIDADAAALGTGRCMNVWMPLDEVGIDRPSLQIVPNSSVAMHKLPLILDGNYARDDAFTKAIGPSIVPVLDPGDAVVFDSYTLHRTQPVSGTSMRTACEFRFALAD